MSVPEPDYWEIDEDVHLEDEEDDGEDCGRWINGTLSRWCTKAGSEECDWICPIGLPRHRRKKRAARAPAVTGTE